MLLNISSTLFYWGCHDKSAELWASSHSGFKCKAVILGTWGLPHPRVWAPIFICSEWHHQWWKQSICTRLKWKSPQISMHTSESFGCNRTFSASVEYGLWLIFPLCKSSQKKSNILESGIPRASLGDRGWPGGEGRGEGAKGSTLAKRRTAAASASRVAEKATACYVWDGVHRMGGQMAYHILHFLAVKASLWRIGGCYCRGSLRGPALRESWLKGREKEAWRNMQFELYLFGRAHEVWRVENEHSLPP